MALIMPERGIVTDGLVGLFSPRSHDPGGGMPPVPPTWGNVAPGRDCPAGMDMTGGSWPVFDGVGDICGTGQGYDMTTPTWLAVLYTDPAAVAALNNDVMTLSVWARPDPGMVAWGSPASWHALHRIMAFSSTWGLYIHGVGWADSGVLWTDGKWHHLALYFERATGVYELAIDGVQVLAGTGSPYAVGTPYAYYVGDNYYSNSPFNGEVDDVAIYDRKLSTDELVRNYHAGMGAHS